MAFASMILLAVSVALPSAKAGNWKTMLMYDVLQEDCRHDVKDKNLGDPAGDAYFNIKDMYLPVACPVCKKQSGGCWEPSVFDCDNPESNGNLVVRQVSVEVLMPFGTYNLCNEINDTDCGYTCAPLPGTKNPIRGVGVQPVCGGDYSHFLQCDMAPVPSAWSGQKWDFWNFNTAALMGQTFVHKEHKIQGNGNWYSLKGADKDKHWRNATILKTINAECQRKWLYESVVTHGHTCFNACPSPKNTSDSCWIECFFDTVLGEKSGASLHPVGGLNYTQVIDWWLAGFKSDDQSVGGCPACPEKGPCNPPQPPKPKPAPAPKPHPPAPKPAPAPKHHPAPHPKPHPAPQPGCSTQPYPLHCPCTHSWDCASDYCVDDVCTKHPPDSV